MICLLSRWIWAEGGANSDLEQNFEVGGFGYPALVGYNSRRKVYSVLRASYSEEGISEFLREIIGQKGRPQSLRGDGLPAVETIEPWDGKDGEVRLKCGGRKCECVGGGGTLNHCTVRRWWSRNNIHVDIIG